MSQSKDPMVRLFHLGKIFNSVNQYKENQSFTEIDKKLIKGLFYRKLNENAYFKRKPAERIAEEEEQSSDSFKSDSSFNEELAAINSLKASKNSKQKLLSQLTVSVLRSPKNENSGSNRKS